ncbi:MAG: EAL domain-containing protein [Acidimicrobiales bacterium]
MVDVDTGKVTKLEALVRWQHPEKGMIPPGAFLSVAAESGLIVDVGEHVLREACRQAKVWSAAIGRPVSVAVNVAERQLIDGHLVETVRRVLAETELDPHQLELEISEELIVERLDGHLHLLHELVDMGVRMALDDFGTSRASLSSLKRLDMVKTLKIDRAFVIDVATDPVDRKIITAIVALAHSVGMEVVAEGVEDADQATVLMELGVSKIQGFYFARPDSSHKVVTALTKRYDLPWDPPKAEISDGAPIDVSEV